MEGRSESAITAGPSDGGAGVSARVDGPTLADAVEEAKRILELGARSSLGLRVMGGVAVKMQCPSARVPPLARTYNDIDYAGRSADSRRIIEFFSNAGYQSDAEFNALHGRQRLFFMDPKHNRDADVFLDTFSMCHTYDFRADLLPDAQTLPPRTLLLFKLQVVEVNEKDYKDALALLADHRADAEGLDAEEIARFVAQDWGWWRTVTLTLGRLRAYAGELSDFPAATEATRNIQAIGEAIERAPKSRRWKLRARVGDRVRWHEVPDEAHG